MVFARVLAGLVFGTWFVLSIVGQLNYKWVQRLLAPDHFRVIPRWTFFAPTPGTFDYHLLFRTLSNEGHLSEFLEVPLRRRGPWAFIWHPSKRVKKASLDLANSIQRLLSTPEWNLANIRGSLPYLMLLNYVSGMEHDPSTFAIQWCVLASAGPVDFKTPRLVLASEFHRVG